MVNFNEGFSKYPSLPVSLFIGKARGRYTFYFSFRTFGHINRIVLQSNKARRARHLPTGCSNET